MTTSKVSSLNKLNDLTGSEWTYFLSSVFETRFPTSGPESYSHKLRKIHPSPKPPQLMEDMIRFFTKKDQWVLDPFAGVGGTLLGASMAGRRAVGIDLEPKYLKIYREVSKIEKLSPQITAVGDSRNIISIMEETRRQAKAFKIPGLFDLILTDPPYGNMMNKKRSISPKNGRSSTPFTGLGADIGNLEHGAFLDTLHEILEKSLSLLKAKGYLVVFTKDMQPKPEHHNMLHADIVARLADIDALRFRGYRIWFDKTQNLYPLGYPHAFVANQFHQYVLIFRKEQK